ncbi:MAG TPA: class I SAM-dependent methyltransferase [Candidatus Limnocylindrales bacterium]
MKFIGRAKADSPPQVVVAVGAIGGSDRKGRQGKALRRLVPTLVVLGLLTAFTKPGRRVTRMLARRLDARVECFTEPGSETYVRFFAPIFEHLYRRVAEDAAREMSVRRLGRGGTVIDIGCGPGDLVVAVSRRLKQARIVGIDLSPSMLLWAGRHATTDGRIKFIVGDGADLPFDDASVDMVVSTLSLHHWDDPADVFAEIARVLRPGGVALIYDMGLLTFTEAEMAVIAVDAGLEPEDIVRERAHGGLIPSLFVRYRVEGLD